MIDPAKADWPQAYQVVTLRREANVARREAANATETASFLTKLFQGANLLQTGGATLTARDLLDRGEKELEERSDLDPAVRARLLVTMARATLVAFSISSLAPVVISSKIRLSAARPPIITATCSRRCALVS